MASGNQLDAQREERWPNQTQTTEKGSTVKVEFKSDEESDDSDLEGAFQGPSLDGEAIEDVEVEDSLWWFRSLKKL